jgi:hypothetical protein
MERDAVEQIGERNEEFGELLMSGAVANQELEMYPGFRELTGSDLQTHMKTSTGANADTSDSARMEAGEKLAVDIHEDMEPVGRLTLHPK